MESDSDSSVYEELDTSEEENGDLSCLSAEAPTTVKVENVQQKCCQVIKKGSEMLIKQIVESCHPPSGDLVPASGSQGLEDRPPLPPRSGNTVIQHNLIQVQQQFGDVTVQGTRNLTIGGTQNICATGASSEKEEKPPTWTERIMKRTVAKVEEWTDGMVKTSALEKVMGRLNQGATWLTIKGSPGEGKSTVAFMTLEELHKSGREVFQVISPEEFSEVISNSSQPVIVLDDIFGELEFDQTEWLRWKSVLHQVLDVKEHRSHEQTTGNSKDRNAIVILVGRDYVLNTASAMMGRQSEFVMQELYVVDMSLSVDRELEEKINIWKAIVEPAGIQFSKKRVEQLCNIKSHHGFPHVCRLFVTIQKDNLKVYAEEFFKSPLDFLNLSIKRFFRDKLKLNLFREMVRNDGKISIEELEILDSDLDTTKTAHDLVGTYLRQEGRYFRFDHPSIYDCVVYNLCKLSPLFVIQNCELSFILKRLRLQPLHDIQPETSYSESGLAIHIPRLYAEDIAKRCAVEISEGNFMQVLSHKVCTDKLFIEMMMSHITVPISKLLLPYEYEQTYTFYAGDNDFIHYISINKSSHLLKYIADKTDILQNQDYTNRVLFGICRHAATDALTYLMENSERFDINAQAESNGQTALMFAAESQDSEFVHKIMTLNPDLSAVDILGRSAFHYLCANGLVSVAEQVLASGTDTDINNCDKRSPLWWACFENQTEMIDFLIQRGASASYALLYSVNYLDSERVENLLKFGADVNIQDEDGNTPLNNAVNRYSPSVEVINVLLKAGADTNVRDGNSPLHTAVKRNKPEIISLLLKTSTSVNVKDKDGHTPLQTAMQKSKAEIISMLLKAGADVNVRDEEGSPLLTTAVQRSDSNHISMLLKAGADVNVQDTDGYTPLHTAVKQTNPVSISKLLKADADVNVLQLLHPLPRVPPPPPPPPLPPHQTVMQKQKKNADVMYLLLTAGADVNVQNNDGNTPLQTAMQKNNAEVISMLLKAGADVNVRDKGGSPLLTTAVQRSDSNYISMLLKAGADVNVQDTDGYTPLHTAVKQNKPVIISKLLNADADVNVPNIDGITPFQTAMQKNKAGVISMLLKAGADVNVRDEEGCTPIQVATLRSDSNTISMLLEVGADVNIQDNEGCTPLKTAFQRHDLNQITMFLVAGADVNIRDTTGYTPLHYASKRGYTEYLVLLLQPDTGTQVYGNLVANPVARVNLQGKDGCTSLHLAVCKGSLECLQVLLNAGADVNVQDNNGLTALSMAVLRGYKGCADLLLKSGADVNIPSSDGNTPLHRAGKITSVDCVYLLLKAGADVNVQNMAGDTPLMAMEDIGAKDCVGLLLSVGADVNTTDRLGQTLLHKLVARRRQDHRLTVQDIYECQELIGLGIHVNKQDKEGNTPLHLLCQAESLENDFHLFSGSSCKGVYGSLITLLVDNGADVNIQNKNGDLALHGWCKELLRQGKKKLTRNFIETDSRRQSTKGCVIS